MKILNIGFVLAGLLFVSAAGCSTTGGDIGGLAPAPKFLKGSIANNIYTSKDKRFALLIPHDQKSYEYTYMQVKEVYGDHEDYVSFGPAAFDQSIYRVDIIARPTQGAAQLSLAEVAPKILASSEEQVQKGYDSKPELVVNNKTQINGHDAYYWQFKQVVPAGKLNSGNPVTLLHDLYVIDFGTVFATAWVQTPENTPASDKGITPEQFAKSFKLNIAVNETAEVVANGGIYHFTKYPVTVVSPAALCGASELATFGAESSVDFGAADRNWQTAGDYAVQVFALPKSINGKQSFLAASKKYLTGYIPNDRKTLGVRPELSGIKEIEVNGLPALQATGLDEGKAMFVATSILNKSSITVVSLLYPVKGDNGSTNAFPWACYNKFVSSVKETD
jgi:hypothetical protein